MLNHSITIVCVRTLIKTYTRYICGFVWEWEGLESGHQRVLNGKQTCGCLSEPPYISQAKPETTGRESKGSSRYLVSLQPRRGGNVGNREGS